MPNRPRGYVRRGEGVLPSDPDEARRYGKRAKYEAVVFDAAVQQVLIDAACESCDRQGYTLHFVATEPTHVHLLVSWRSRRSWLRVRTGLKQSLTRQLNRRPGRRLWFAASGSRKRVKDQAHFEYLVNDYLPNHRGLQWRNAPDAQSPIANTQ